MADQQQWTEAKKAKFLKFFARSVYAGNVTACAKKVGMGRGSVYELKNRDTEFAEAMTEAAESAYDSIEFVAHHRAIKGWKTSKTVTKTRQIFVKDGDSEAPAVEIETTTTEEWKIDNALLMRLLEARRPQTWQRGLKLDGSEGFMAGFASLSDLVKLSLQELTGDDQGGGSPEGEGGEGDNDPPADGSEVV